MVRAPTQDGFLKGEFPGSIALAYFARRRFRTQGLQDISGETYTYARPVILYQFRTKNTVSNSRKPLAYGNVCSNF